MWQVRPPGRMDRHAAVIGQYQRRIGTSHLSLRFKDAKIV